VEIATGDDSADLGGLLEQCTSIQGEMEMGEVLRRSDLLPLPAVEH
jgi:hypothetical protein